MRWVRAAVRSWVRPGRAREIHASLPVGLVVHAVAGVLTRVVCASVSDAAALGEGALDQDVLRVGFA